MSAYAITVLKKEQNFKEVKQIAAFCCYIQLINQHWLQKENDANGL